jgi:hypothetical protein
MQKASMIEISRASGLFECPSMGAYVKIKFVPIRVMVGELSSYYITVGSSDNDFFIKHGVTIIVQSELNSKNIANIYGDVRHEYKT